MGSLLIVTGPPGAGKSTVAAALAGAANPSVLIAGDAFFGFLGTGAIEPWLSAANDQNTVVTAAAAAAAGVFARAYVTVYDGVVGPWFLPTFATATGLDELDYVVLLPDVELCVRRVATRVGHGFTDEPATRKMHAEFVASEVDERHIIRDGGDDPGAVMQLISNRRDDRQLRYPVREQRSVS